MIGTVMQRRNRYKRRGAAPRPFFERVRAFIDWRALARRSALLALFGAGLGALAWGLNRPVTAVAIDGHFRRVTPVEVEKAVARYLPAGFMSANLDGIQRAVEALPWVDSVRVQRRWPNGLRVSVVEQQAVARWNGSGLLNARGELFLRHAVDAPPGLPLLGGPPGSAAEVAKVYLRTEPLMVAAGMRIADLGLDARGAWRMSLSNGLAVRLGRKHVERRMRRFIRTASRVVMPRLNEVAYVDMRYSNGFAIGWRAGAKPVTGGAPAPTSSPAPAASATPARASAGGARLAPAPSKHHVQKEA